MVRSFRRAGLAALALFAHCAAADIDRDAAMQASQAAVGRVLSDLTFTDARNEAVRLADFRGKPVLVSMIFTSCHHICPTLTSSLKQIADTARDTLGEGSFAVLTVGFDTVRDTPQRMASYAGARGIDDPDWRFLAGDAATVAQLAAELGFHFAPAAGGFDHLMQTTILDGDGRVYRQLYGSTFDPLQFTGALRDLAIGLPVGPTLSHWLDRIQLLCTVYDPASGRYRLDYSIVVAVGSGVLCLGLVAFCLVRLWRTD